MKLIRTVRIKLTPNQLDGDLLRQTVDLMTKAYNFCCSTGYQNNTKNGIVLHHLTYSNLRSYLPSQLACSARMAAVRSLKSLDAKHKKTLRKNKNATKPRCPQSNRIAVGYDRNSYTIWFDKQQISILTANGRLRLPFAMNKYLKDYTSSSWKSTAATLKIDKKNKFFLNVCFEKDISDTEKNGNYIGIDRGIRRLAVSSNNKFYSGGKVRKTSQKYSNLRSKLQKCGTRSAIRHLCRLRGKEQRFKSDVNHCISKKILSELYPGDTIVLENLSGIRNKRMRKKQRKEVNSWNFYQLEQYLTYKSEALGVHIEHVDARYTSQRCSKCGHIKRSNRKSQSDFCCKKCGFRLNADLNAARNIVLKHLDSKAFYESRESDRAEVNQPNVRLAFGKQGTSPCL